MKTKFGIDVSKWQGNIDWKKASKQIDFAMIRAGYGSVLSQKDTKFESNYNGCKANNVPVGAYWYNYAKTVEDAKQEAKVCIQVLKNHDLDYPVFYDVEEKSVLALGKTKVSAITKAFLNELEAAGYRVGIYSMLSALNNYFSDDLLNTYDVWLAHVNVKQTSYKKPYAIWQYSWVGKIDGISGDVDCNYCYKDYSIIKDDPVTVEVPASQNIVPTLESVARDVIAGKYGNGAARVSALQKAGYNSSNVQAAVNAIVSGKTVPNLSLTEPNKPVQNTVVTLESVARDVIAGKYGAGSARVQSLTKAGFNAQNVQYAVNAILAGKSVPNLSLYKKSVEEIAKEVIQGKWGSGTTRKKKLEAAGYNYSAVQTYVNKLMKK